MSRILSIKVTPKKFDIVFNSRHGEKYKFKIATITPGQIIWVPTEYITLEPNDFITTAPIHRLYKAYDIELELEHEKI